MRLAVFKMLAPSPPATASLSGTGASRVKQNDPIPCGRIRLACLNFAEPRRQHQQWAEQIRFSGHKETRGRLLTAIEENKLHGAGNRPLFDFPG